MGDNKRKHLEFVENVIARKNSNSFLIKGWTVALVSALLALTYKDPGKNYFLIGYFVIINFWILDGFFISHERRYRSLYEKVASQTEEEIDFNMETSAFKGGKNLWCDAIFSWTLLLFYGVIFLEIILLHLISNG